MQFNCICLPIVLITWLLAYANQKVASISHRIWIWSQVDVFFRFVLMKIGFLLPLIFIISLPLHSLHFFNFWFHFSLHLINILYYVLYWSNGRQTGRTILVLFCMNVHCNQFNVFVLVYVYSFDWMQLWAVVRTRERVKKMIKRMVFLTDCNHARECIEQWSNKRMKCTQKKLNFKSFVWDEANG